MSLSRRLAVALGTLVVLVMTALPADGAVAARSIPDAKVVQPGSAVQPSPAPAVPPQRRIDVLGAGWEKSADRALVASGDADGFHILVADASDGYVWRTLTTLAEPGLEADQWIGNACVTGSGRQIVVVYAPRTFTNRSYLFDRGGFTAVVDMRTGAVTKLPVLSTLAYFNPACGPGDDALLTQFNDEKGRTRLIRVNAAGRTVRTRIEVAGQLGAVVPTAGGIVAADRGALVQVAGDGSRRVLARSHGVPFKGA